MDVERNEQHGNHVERIEASLCVKGRLDSASRLQEWSTAQYVQITAYSNKSKTASESFSSCHVAH